MTKVPLAALGARVPAGGAPPSGGPKGPRKQLFLNRYSPVEMSADLRRILDLPRRVPLDVESPRAEALVEMMTARWSRNVPSGECACARIDPRIAAGKRRCITHLKPTQAWVLYEIGVHGGVLCNIPVGAGKTFLDVMALMAYAELGVRNGLLLVPPNLMAQLHRDARLINEHFQVPKMLFHDDRKEKRKRIEGDLGAPILHVLPYSRLSQPTSSDWVRNLDPDAIIADEVDRLANPSGAGSSRIFRYFLGRGDTRPVYFAGWTGSLTDQSITEYAHLSALALRESSPLPLDKGALMSWARAVDASDNPAPPGELGQLCDEERDEDPNTVDGVREAFRRRLAETPGFIISTEVSVSVDLEITKREAPPVPAIIEKALAMVRGSWVRPDTLVGSDYDEELVQATEVAKVARELASGIFYRWKFPRIHGEPQRIETIKEWKDARREWNRELRSVLRDREEWLDSPKLCELAAQRFWGDRPKRDDRPEWDSATWCRWRDVKDLVKYEVEPCRVSDYLAADAAEWARSHLGIVWYGMTDFGQWVAELSGLPLHTGGPKAEERIMAETGGRSIIASIESHGRGRDGLQVLYSQQLVSQPPSSSRRWEQLLGRLERDGQRAERVTAEYYAPTDELQAAFDTALLRAGYVRGTQGQTHKLIRGTQGSQRG